MSYKPKDAVHARILKKFEDGIFTMGEDCTMTRYYFERNISTFPFSERTPEICWSLMAYSRCRLSDVPETSRTRDFFIAAFTNDEVYHYIENHIADFDRQFFKDLITTNEYATNFEKNCFAIMPTEYIDEEMCSIAILKALNWSHNNWFLSVYKRKPEALTADLWKFGARLYSRMSGKNNEFLSITPDEFKDIEYYIEMCSCNYNCGMELDTNKGKIMESLPKEVLTPVFLVALLALDLKNVARFSDEALETEYKYTKENLYVEEDETVVGKLWQIVVQADGYLIQHMKLNEERIEFFLKHYDKDSGEYRWGFKDNYKTYMKQKENAKALAQTNETTKENALDTANSIILNAMVYAVEGEEPTKAIADEVDRIEIIVNQALLPIEYKGMVPQAFCKEYDGEEYLAMIYKKLGIEIVKEYDSLFYKVILPNGWSIDKDGYSHDVKDTDGNTIIEYFYDSKFYDRDAYVKTINMPIEKTNGGRKKLTKK